MFFVAKGDDVDAFSVDQDILHVAVDQEGSDRGLPELEGFVLVDWPRSGTRDIYYLHGVDVRMDCLVAYYKFFDLCGFTPYNCDVCV